MSQEKEAQKKFYKTREDKELEKVIAVENKINVLDDIVYKTDQSIQTKNMLNRNCKTSFVKLEFLKKAQRANHRLYDIGCYNDNYALMLAPESDETIRLAQESRSKLNSLEKKDFSKSRSATKNKLSKDLSKPVTTQILPQNVNTVQKNPNVIAPRMYKVHTRLNQTRTTQLPQDIRKTNKRVYFSTGVIPTTSVSRPQLKST
ncbi:hypothetical protein Tco_0955110 [Tanacetum coccineum]|uniref:Uncharacterized protein n=1 Tax=Tanacetum coccineum TaxID=301880 RepID=A0ABQ5E694_9ASTR